jgi:ribokinase
MAATEDPPKPEIVVIGGVGVDYVVHGGDACGPGESAQGDAFLEAPGGKGGNQAVAVARLGLTATLVACLGRDQRGDWLLDQLATEDVRTQYVARTTAAASAVTLIHVDDAGRKHTFAAPGANRHLVRTDIEAAIRRARALLAQLEVPLDCVIEAVRHARDAGVMTILDPAPATKLPEPVLQLIDVIRSNAREAEVLSGIEVHDRGSARRARNVAAQARRRARRHRGRREGKSHRVVR